MAVYKVLQDIEAEDKLLGPLTLKGFIYAAAAFVLGFINFKLLISGGGFVKIILVFVLLFPMILFGVLASPLGRQQPTEVWLLARIRFLLKPNKRVWDQTGISHLVTITAPKKVEKILTKNLSEPEIRNRLQTLASTLDSRGWAIKNLRMPMAAEASASDRLVSPTTVSPVAMGIDLDASDDILDEENNPTALNLESLIQKSEARRRVGLAQRLTDARKTVGQATEEPKPAPKNTASPEVTRTLQADKLELAQSGSALSVASVQHLANRKGIQQIGPNEVVITLH